MEWKRIANFKFEKIITKRYCVQGIDAIDFEMGTRIQIKITFSNVINLQELQQMFAVPQLKQFYDVSRLH